MPPGPLYSEDLPSSSLLPLRTRVLLLRERKGAPEIAEQPKLGMPSPNTEAKYVRFAPSTGEKQVFTAIGSTP